MARLEVFELLRSRYAEVAQLYAECGYRQGLTARDHVFAATRDGVLIGVVRLCPEHGTAVLRGMQVRPAHQRSGVGSLLLDTCVAALGDAVCYCLPWRSLETFYGRGGFRRLALTEAPPFLRDRCTTYRAAGHDAIVTRRP